jgi:hypothetical protein
MEEQNRLLRDRPVSVVTVEPSPIVQPIPDEPVKDSGPVGRPRQSVKLEQCIAYLRANPKAMDVSNRELEETVKIATYRTWGDAKRQIKVGNGK